MFWFSFSSRRYYRLVATDRYRLYPFNYLKLYSYFLYDFTTVGALMETQDNLLFFRFQFLFLFVVI